MIEQPADFARTAIGASSRACTELSRAAVSDPRKCRAWAEPLGPLLKLAARAPTFTRLLTTDRSGKSRQLAKTAKLVRHFEGEWKILKNRRFHSDGREYCVDVVMIHQSHGIALISFRPMEYTIPDLAIDVVRRILNKSEFSGPNVTGLPIVFVSAYECSFQEVADQLRRAFSSVPLTTSAGRWESRAYKTLSSAKYDSLPDDFGMEIINPSSATKPDQCAGRRQSAVPGPIILYYVACSSVGLAAGIALTATILLL